MRLLCAAVIAWSSTSIAEPGPDIPTKLDGLAIGDPITSLPAPYDQPCSSERVEDHFRMRLYPAQNCIKSRGKIGPTFPDGTTAAIILDDGKLVAFGWIGGTHFDNVKLGFKLGDPVERAKKAYGAPTGSLDLHTLHVDRFKGDLATLSHDGAIVGVVIGAMPEKADGERWRMLDDQFRCCSARPVSVQLSEAKCRQLMAHVAKVEGSKVASDKAESDLQLKRCREQGAPTMADCVLASQTSQQLAKCEH